MKEYLEKRNMEVINIVTAMTELRDREIKHNGPHAALFTKVVSELSYRIAAFPDENDICPKCDNSIPKAEYDHYCSFCGQFILK